MTQTHCPHTHSSSSKLLLILEDKGKRDYTLIPTTPGPANGVHFSSKRGNPSRNQI